MKWLLSAALLLGLGLGVILLAPSAAARGPVPIIPGRDSCDRCHMPVTAGRAGGERIDAQGRRATYDDVGCLLLAIWAAHDATPEAFVEDHRSGVLIPLLGATFVRGELPTPMGYGVLAFREPQAAAAFAGEHHAEVATLEDLLRDRERFSASRLHTENERQERP